MQISGLNPLTQIGADDVVAIEVNGVTYKTTARTLGLITQVYPVRGAIIKSASSGTTIGYGDAMVTVTGKLVTVDFEGLISTAGTVARLYDVGVQVANLRTINTYIPEFRVENSGIIHYFNSSGALDVDKEGYAGDAMINTALNAWTFGRMYTPDGNLGAWADAGFYSGLHIMGTLYGSIA